MIAQNEKRFSTFVLLDLDNWGWKNWSSGQSSSLVDVLTCIFEKENKEKEKNHDKKRKNGVFVWAFYGGGYDRYLPSEQDKERFQSLRRRIWEQVQEKQQGKREEKDSKKKKKKETTKKEEVEENNVFEYLLSKNALRLSPSGWSDQSADLAIRKMSKLLLNRVNVCVITRDEDLRLECERNAESKKKENKRENKNGKSSGSEETDKAKKFCCIRPHVVGYNNVLTHVHQFVTMVNENDGVAKDGE